MYLKRLEIHGFKSFAQKASLEFSPGIIAIVGPNGSGKSNVADAVRWVLGEQSPKLMRGKKAEDVIFAGSDKKSRLSFCEVTATFENSDRKIPLDSPEVAIGRRVDRSGNSEYLLNGGQVRLLDIIDLVLRSNIGTSRYTVIGQGTIDQMVLAGSAEVKSLLDEASGVKTYYIRRDKTLRRLEQTAQNLIRAEDLIAEIAPRLRSLRRQAKRMEARVEIENELKIYQRDYFGKTYSMLYVGQKAQAEKISVLENQKKVLTGESQKLTRQAEDQETDKGQNYSSFQNIQQEMEDVRKQKNRFLEDLSMVRGKMQSRKNFSSKDAQSLRLSLHSLESRISELQKEQSQSLAKARQAKQQSIEFKETLKNLENKINIALQTLIQPQGVNWPEVEVSFSDLDLAFNEFSANLESNQPWEQIKISIERLKKSYIAFKTFVANSTNTRKTYEEAQSLLMALQTEKQNVENDLRGQELIFSQSELSGGFMLKQIDQLNQEKLQTELELKEATSDSVEDFVKGLIVEEQKIKTETDGLTEKIEKLQGMLAGFQKEENARNSALREAESFLRKKQDELFKINDQISILQVEKARLDTQSEVLTEEIKRILGIEALNSIILQAEENKESFSETPQSELEQKILKLKQQLDLIGGIDELTLQEYKETEERYGNLSAQINDLKKSMQDLRQILDELDEHIKKQFNLAFHRINEKFEYYFRLLFNGGRAYLSLLKAQDEHLENNNDNNNDNEEKKDELRPEEKIVRKYEKGGSNIIGVDIKATPPGKKLSSIQALSGGERSLTSIALLCSLLSCFPSPFVVLDEVDAALDDANTIRFGQILGSLAGSTQFVTITHNRETMSQAHTLYGVTMGDDGVSKLLSVKLEQAKVFAK